MTSVRLLSKFCHPYIPDSLVMYVGYFASQVFQVFTFWHSAPHLGQVHLFENSLLNQFDLLIYDADAVIAIGAAFTTVGTAMIIFPSCHRLDAARKPQRLMRRLSFSKQVLQKNFPFAPFELNFDP